MSTSKAILVIGGIVIAIAASQFGWSHFKKMTEAARQTRLLPDDLKIVAEGKLIYVQHCADCHGQNLEGEANWRVPLPNGRMPAPPHNAEGHTWHHADALLFAITKHGPGKIIGSGYKSNMPGYVGLLSDEQIIQVLSFIKSTWPENIRKHHDENNKAALSRAATVRK